MDRRAPGWPEPPDDAARLAELLEQEVAVDDTALDEVARRDEERLGEQLGGGTSLKNLAIAPRDVQWSTLHRFVAFESFGQPHSTL